MAADGGRRPLPRLVWAIAAAQLVSWATLYYSFAVLIGPIEADLGWSRSDVTGGFTAGLVTAAVLAPLVGRLLDRYGGFWLMTGGSVAGAAALLLWSCVDSLAGYYLVWLVIGAAMASTFYEAGFAVVTAASGTQFRRAITTVTLVAGFAGTLAFPLTQALVEAVGWREALVVLAALTLLVPAVIHGLALRRQAPSAAVTAAPLPSGGAVRRALLSPAYWGLLAAVIGHALLFTGVTFHIAWILGARGYTPGEVFAAWALVGPAQVGARVVLFSLQRHLGPLSAGALAFGLTAAAGIYLLLGPPALFVPAVAAVLFGAGNGLATIVRATTIPELLGTAGYASIAGTIVLPSMLAVAFGPSLTAWLAAAGGYGLAVGTLVALAAAGGLAFAAGILLHRRMAARVSGAR